MSENQAAGQVVARVSGAVTMIERENFAAVLPAHIPPLKYQRWALGVLQRPELAEVARTEAGRLSIITALLDCASLGLEPGRTFHLVPFGGTVTGITDYKGEIELIYRACRRPVIAMLVHAKDDFAMTGANVPPRHDADWFSADRGPVTGGYAYVDFGQGICSLVVRMSEEEFLRHRAKARAKTAWDEWPEAMRLKTLVHQLRKFVPWSAEWVS